MSDLRKADLAQIHIAKKALGLDDDTYRDMLWTVARVRSSKELDATGRAQVLAHLRACGWAPAPRRAAPAAAQRQPPAVRFVYALWGLLARHGQVQDASPGALRAWIRHWTGLDAGDGAPEWLDTATRARVTEYLVQWCMRAKIYVAALDRPQRARRSRS